MTMDDYLAARMISSPFGLYDCDVPCDGSIALVVSAVDTALDLRQPPIFVEAVGTQVIDRISWDQGVLSHEPQTRGPAAHLWTRTDLPSSMTALPSTVSAGSRRWDSAASGRPPISWLIRGGSPSTVRYHSTPSGASSQPGGLMGTASSMKQSSSSAEKATHARWQARRLQSSVPAVALPAAVSS